MPQLANFPARTFCGEKFRADHIRGALERVWWSYWDTAVIDRTDATTSRQKLFRVPAGSQAATGAVKTEHWTNMQGAGVLPDPQEFVMHFAGVHLYPYTDANTTIKDLVTTLNNTYIKLEVNQKTYYESMGGDMPAGAAQTAFTDAALAAAVNEFAWNGIGDQRAMKRFWVPCYVLKNQSFFWEFYLDPAYWGGMTATATVYFQLFMHGELYRAIT